MMNVNFFNNGDYKPQPKDKVKINELTAFVHPDRRRIRIGIKVTPFQERPNLLITLRRADGQLIDDVTVIETMHFDNEFTMHLRGADDPAGAYTVTVDLFYETRNPPQDQETISFDIPTEGEA